MGFLPSLGAVKASRDMTATFGGYNHNPVIAANEFYDMRNMSSDGWPLLCPREARRKVRTLEKPNGLCANEKLAWVDGTGFYYDGQKYGTVADSKKQFVNMGAYILIWPDKAYFNTKTHEFGSMENHVSVTGSVTVSLCKRDGTVYSGYTAASSPPASPSNGALWIDTSAAPHVLKQYAASLKMWTSVPTTYVKIAATGIGTGFLEGDGVTIAGMKDANLNGSFVLQGAGSGYLVITAIVDKVSTQTGGVLVSRTVPKMDYMTECENRIWGCSSEKHEIYACVQGDFKNWNRYLGISTDSYAATIGTSGDFTGCITHLGYVLFFKPDVIHKIYGNRPSNYQITSTNCRGVQKGSEKSLVIVNETLYYKAENAVCAYNAALPSSVSEAFGNVFYKSASAGKCGSKYYISMKDGQGQPVFFVYDTAKNIWHREDGTFAEYFAAAGGALYFIDAAGGLYETKGGTEDVEWMAQTGDIGLLSPDAQYISKIQIRLEAEQGALIRIEVQYDGESAWQEKYRINVTKRRSFAIPIIPRRCDTMRIRIVGRGKARVYSIAKTIEQGGEA